MKVAVIGSRSCGPLNAAAVKRHLPQSCTRIISGGASGVDACAEAAAKELHIPFLKILPDYRRYGKAAPLLRNSDIVSQADLVLAFWDYHSRGTADVIAKCVERGVPFRIIGLTPEQN